MARYPIYIGKVHIRPSPNYTICYIRSTLNSVNSSFGQLHSPRSFFVFFRPSPHSGKKYGFIFRWIMQISIFHEITFMKFHEKIVFFFGASEFELCLPFHLV